MTEPAPTAPVNIRETPPETAAAALPAPVEESWAQRLALFRYLRPHTVSLVLAFVALMGGTSLRLFFPYMAGLQVDGTFQALVAAKQGEETAEAILPSAAPEWLYDIHTMALLLFGIIVLILIFTGFEMLAFARAGESALAALRVDAYRQVIHAPMSFHSQRRVGELGNRLLTDLTLLQETWVNDLPSLLKHAVLLLGGIGLMMGTNLQLSLVIFIVVPCAVGVALLLGKLVRRISRDAQDQLAAAGTIVEETLQGIQTVKAFAMEGAETRRYHGAIGGFLRPALGGARMRAGMVCTILLLALGMFIYVMWHGSVLVERGALTPGEFTRFMFYLAFAGSAAGTVADTVIRVQKSLGAADRVSEILREPTEEADDPSAALPRPAGKVEFRAVNFAYPAQADMPVLRDLSFTVQPGQRVALVGPSGAGKSTIVSLILRFFEPQTGHLLVDDRPTGEYPLQWLRRQMALVPQDPLLFGGSIRENIAYGAPESTLEQVQEAARRAHAEEFINNFPQGYETTVGERGMRLSGGQRQRIAIARAILKNPAILLLDEATSSLDAESEHHVQAALEELMQGRTTFVIAHRLSTVRQANCILVIDRGRLVEMGTHGELIARNGLYQKLCHRQLQADED